MKTNRVFNLVYLVFIIGVFIIAFKNFSTPYFYLNDYVYEKKSDDGNETIYYSIRAKKFIKVSEKEGYKEINIEDEIYIIYGQPIEYISKDEKDMLKIEYQDGTVKEGWYYKNIGFYKKDEKGEIDFSGNIQINVGNKEVNGDDELTDRKLMTMAFESLQDKKGVSEMLWLGVLFSFIGFIQFKYPTFGFRLKYFMWVKDPEPTDAYIAFSKIGGLILCVMGIGMMIYGAGIFEI